MLCLNYLCLCFKISKKKEKKILPLRCCNNGINTFKNPNIKIIFLKFEPKYKKKDNIYNYIK